MKGLSYQNGVLFIGKEYIGWACWDNRRPVSRVLPVSMTAMLKIGQHVFKSMPLWYKVTSGLLICLVFLPDLLGLISGTRLPGVPLYILLYYLMGTHFFFPAELRKFHGAEHKVFSYKGVKRRKNLHRIRQSAITNRYCSTNTVILYFLLTGAGYGLMRLWFSWDFSLETASYAAVPLSMAGHRLLQMERMSKIRAPFLRLSYFVQRHIACSAPERKHLRTALEAYRALAEQEFPHLLEERKSKITKEAKQMAIVDITVVPVGTESTSISEDVAQIQHVLNQHTDKLDYQLTSMGTIIEGNLKDIFPIVEELHDIPFQRGAKRVSTNIRIDDRRDTEGGSMKDKVQSVENKMS
ncbi:MTH1187 family thiamine-binding protein [Salibacterium aidingense]|uniref:MTH1187 family thiamine-binding protein n=1 Tax=Salibacterium aidingense TaxID=384933 RepID=UPI003BBE3B78